jgi:hypothetical protein
MKYQVYDCLSDHEITVKDTRKEADEICAIHGGNDACIHVFEIAELKEVKRELKEEIKEQKPLAGMLF